MIPEQRPWQDRGARVAVDAREPGRFLGQHVLPLFFRQTVGDPSLRDRANLISEEQFWGHSSNVVLGAVRLNGFRLTDWFPRTPGVYWSIDARITRENVWSAESHSDAELGRYFSPESKMNLIEGGGIGSIRLRPRRIDGEDCWLATALTGAECHSGVPLAIPAALLREAGVAWGDRVNIEGRVRFLQDAGLDDIAASVHHARPLIVFVDGLKGTVTQQSREPIVITPVALFASADSEPRHRHRPRYTFVQCAAGSDAELDGAADWIERYARRHAGQVLTNFDEQRPVLADAPLSYQRLVAKTYDRTIIERFAGTMLIGRIDQFVQEGHRIEVGGSANINIDATLSNVTQAVNSAPGGAGQRPPKRLRAVKDRKGV